MNDLTHLSLFSGIGGLDLAAECNEKLMLEAADALEAAIREQEQSRWIPVRRQNNE